jgi:hypothetical protein
LSDAERFRKIGPREWRVAFARGVGARKAITHREKQPINPVEAALVQRGVANMTAAKIARELPAARIQRQLEAFDWLLSQKDARVSRNPPGFLVSAIKGEYTMPPCFTPSVTARECQKTAHSETQPSAAIQETAELEREGAIARYWDSLSKEEQLQLESQALVETTAFHRTLIKKGGPLAAAARKAALDACILSRVDRSASQRQ